MDINRSRHLYLYCPVSPMHIALPDTHSFHLDSDLMICVRVCLLFDMFRANGPSARPPALIWGIPSPSSPSPPIIKGGGGSFLADICAAVDYDA